MNTALVRNIKYFSISETDEKWGLIVTTVGHQAIPSYSSYPVSAHPKSHLFSPKSGRILKEYQLIYITNGYGFFESASCSKRRVEPGSFIFLFPNEWHTYEPDKEYGWVEYWVGFKGEDMDKRVMNGFFSPASPICKLGFNYLFINLYEEILNYASEEKSGYQQVISSIVIYMLGMLFYNNKNLSLNDSYAINKINDARNIMRNEIETNISAETIAYNLGVSYSWFRKTFKKYVDVSPAQYQASLRLLRAKELLESTDLPVKDIAYRLNFESPGRFSTFFRQKEGVPPLAYRKGGNRKPI